MKNRIQKFCYWGFSLFLFIILFLPLKKTFFFHDEWTFIYQILTSPRDFFFKPHNGHFWPLFSLIYFLEYKLFGLNYPFYQLVLLVFHFVNGYLLYLIIHRLTKNQNLGILAFFLFIINAVYWEVIFASATLPTVLCLFFIALAMFNYLKYQDSREKKHLIFSGLFSLLSSYAWGAGLFFPFLFLGTVLAKKLFREKIRVEEILVYSFAGFISIGSYFLFAGTLSAPPLDLKKIAIFTLTAIKWIIVSFYTSSPGMLTLFGLITIFLSLVFYSVLGDKKRRQKFFVRLAKNKLILFFALVNFVYLYLLAAVFRYQIDMELAKSSRYTYLPLFFLIVINLVVFNVLLHFLSRGIKFLFLSYFLFLMIANIYFFRIYYQNWTATISGPNKEIFQRITQVSSREELEKIDFPPTFHSFFEVEKFYYIYNRSR